MAANHETENESQMQVVKIFDNAMPCQRTGYEKCNIRRPTNHQLAGGKERKKERRRKITSKGKEIKSSAHKQAAAKNK